MSTDYEQGFYLGDLLVEPLRGLVTSKDDVRHLSPKAAEVLLCLASSPGELVTRDNLLANAWGEGEGSHEALSHAVSEIRHAFGGHQDDPHIIQTLPKRGYRLLAHPVDRDDFEQTTPGPNTDSNWYQVLLRHGVIQAAAAYLVVGWLLVQVADTTFSKIGLPPWAESFVTFVVIGGFPLLLLLAWSFEFVDGRVEADEGKQTAGLFEGLEQNYIAIFIAYGLSAIGAGVYQAAVGFEVPVMEPTVASEAGPEIFPVVENSIAVLPFLNVDGSTESQVFANGLVDDVINRLARVPGLRVASRGDSFTLDPNTASALVRRRLRVAMYLEGSVQIASDRIRVIVQLINTNDGFHVLSRTFDRPREDFFDIRDEVTSLTVSSLRVALPNEMQSLSTASSPNPDLDAYVLYRRGVDESRKPHSTSTAAVALGWFDAALEVDPDYAAAHAGKCSTHTNSYQYNDDPDFIVSAQLACGRALELNPNLFVVHNALGGLFARTGKYGEAEASYMESLRISPENVPALTGLSDVYRLLQRADEAEATLIGAVGLEPGNWAVYNHLGYFYYRQGRYTQAAEQYAMVVSIDNMNMRGYGNLAVSHMMAGNFALAAPAFERSIELEPQASSHSNLGLMQYYLGDYDNAILSLNAAVEIAPNDHLFWSNLGDIFWVAGQRNDAAEAYQEAAERADTALEVNPNDAAVMMDRAWIRAMLGDREAALEEIGRASSRLPDDPYADYIRTLIYNRYGETDAAIESLERAVDKGYSVIILGTEPQLASLHDDPRFIAIVGAENVPD